MILNVSMKTYSKIKELESKCSQNIPFDETLWLKGLKNIFYQWSDEFWNELKWKEIKLVVK